MINIKYNNNNMNNKFNSLFDDNVSNGEFYNISNKDNIMNNTRLKDNSLILNFNNNNIQYQKYLEQRNFGVPQTILLDGRYCSTSKCNTYNKFCDSSGWPEIITKNDNKYSGIPNSNIIDQKKYSENINFESNFKNIDYKNFDCENEYKTPEKIQNNICLGGNLKINENTKNINSNW